MGKTSGESCVWSSPTIVNFEMARECMCKPFLVSPSSNWTAHNSTDLRTFRRKQMAAYMEFDCQVKLIEKRPHQEARFVRFGHKICRRTRRGCGHKVDQMERSTNVLDEPKDTRLVDVVDVITKNLTGVLSDQAKMNAEACGGLHGLVRDVVSAIRELGAATVQGAQLQSTMMRGWMHSNVQGTEAVMNGGEGEISMDERMRNHRCPTKILAMQDCYKKYPREPERGMLCKRLSQAAAMCLLSLLCPSEFEDVQSFCSSAGTATKRKQCKDAQTRLDICISAHQH